jgi:hypothetical protein
MKSKKDILRFSNPMKAKKCRKDHDKPFFYTFSIFVVPNDLFSNSFLEDLNRINYLIDNDL